MSTKIAKIRIGDELLQAAQSLAADETVQTGEKSDLSKIVRRALRSYLEQQGYIAQRGIKRRPDAQKGGRSAKGF